MEKDQGVELLFKGQLQVSISSGLQGRGIAGCTNDVPGCFDFRGSRQCGIAYFLVIEGSYEKPPLVHKRLSSIK